MEKNSRKSRNSNKKPNPGHFRPKLARVSPKFWAIAQLRDKTQSKSPQTKIKKRLTKKHQKSWKALRVEPTQKHKQNPKPKPPLNLLRVFLSKKTQGYLHHKQNLTKKKGRDKVHIVKGLMQVKNHLTRNFATLGCSKITPPLKPNPR
jgi:hypothetical protein